PCPPWRARSAFGLQGSGLEPTFLTAPLRRSSGIASAPAWFRHHSGAVPAPLRHHFGTTPASPSHHPEATLALRDTPSAPISYLLSPTSYLLPPTSYLLIPACDRMPAVKTFTVAALAGATALATMQAPAQGPTWTPQTSGVKARLRGVSAVGDKVVWASGASGTVLRTADGGATWRKLSVPDADTLDFRDVDAVDETTAYLLSIGSGPLSRIYKTTDAGAHWTLQFTNGDPKAFYDAMAFWDAGHGLAISDSVDGRFVILRTRDGGKTWAQAPADKLPPALPNEGAFAGSGTNIAVVPGGH